MQPKTLRILGILLMGSGGTWALQGMGIISYEMIPSPMAGVGLWIKIGGAVFVIGLVLLLLGIRASKRAA